MKPQLKFKELPVMHVSQNAHQITLAQVTYQQEPPQKHFVHYKPQLEINIVHWSVQDQLLEPVQLEVILSINLNIFKPYNL